MKRKETNDGYFASNVCAIRPSLGFYVNEEALEDNMFIDKEIAENMTKKESTQLAVEEFEEYVSEMRDNGINVEVYD